MYKKYLFIIIIGALMLSGCEKPQDTSESESILSQVKTLDLNTFTPTYIVNEIGTIKPSQEIEIISEASGIITNIYRAVGKPVKRNQILVALEQDNTGNIANVNLNTAKNRLSNARENLTEIQKNNQENVNIAQIRVQTSQDQLTKMERNLQELKETNNKNQRNLTLQLQNTQKNLDNTQLNLQHTRDQFKQSWNNYYAETQIAIENVLLNITNYLNSIDDVIHHDDRDLTIYDAYGYLLGARDSSQKNETLTLYQETQKLHKQTKELYTKNIPLNSENTKNVLIEIQKLSKQLNVLSNEMRQLLENTISGNGLSQTDIDTLRDQMSNIGTQILSDLNIFNQLTHSRHNLKIDENTQIQIAENNVTIATNQSDNAQQELEKFQISSNATISDLSNQINVTKKEFAITQANLKSAQRTQLIQNNTAELEVNALADQMQIARTTFRNNQINSPINGVLDHLNIDVGDYITAGSNIGKVIKYQQIKIVFYVDANIASYLNTNQAIQFQHPNFPENAFQGVVAKIAPMADSVNKKFRIEAVASNNNLILKPEMFVELQIDISQKFFTSNQIYIPLNAVLFDQNEQNVFIFKDGITHKKPVKVGKVINKWAEITSGLTADDQIIIEGNRNIKEGQKVELANSQQLAINY